MCKDCSPLCPGLHTSRGVRGIFFRGDKVIFPDFLFPSVKCFFPVEKSILVDPKQISVVLKSEKHKKKKKKKKVPSSFCNFPPSIFNFTPSLFLFQFSFFPAPFYFFFSLPLFSQWVNRNFPVRSLGEGTGGHCVPYPLPPVTPLHRS